MYGNRSVVFKNIFWDNYVKITGYSWIFDFNAFAKLAFSPILADHIDLGKPKFLFLTR